MVDVFDVILRALLAAIGAGILTLIIYVIKWVCKKFKADSLTLKALAHDAYFRDCREILRRESDEIDKEDLENHGYLYDGYKAQGLNGTGDKLHEEILKKTVRIRW